jgi:hypothetical protein
MSLTYAATSSSAEEVFALQVLDQRDLKGFAIAHVANRDRHRLKSRQSSAQPPFTCDQFELPVALPHHEGFDNAVLADRFGHLAGSLRRNRRGAATGWARLRRATSCARPASGSALEESARRSRGGGLFASYHPSVDFRRSRLLAALEDLAGELEIALGTARPGIVEQDRQPEAGLSLNRTLRGITVRKTLSPKCCRACSATW